MMRGMAGKAPLLLAAFLFGIGASGLVLLSLTDRSSWGPFRPQVGPRLQQRVIVLDVGTPFTPPPLVELLAGGQPGRTEGLAVEASAAAGAGELERSLPTPTPIPPIRVHGVAASDGVSAAGATPTPPPPVRIVNVAAEGDASDVSSPEEGAPAEGESPAAGE